MIKVYGRDPNIKTFDAAKTFLEGRPKRKLVNNTFLEMRDTGAIALRYHATDVVTYHADGRIVLNTDGWKTVSTLERLNAFSPVRVYVRRGVWLIERDDGNGAIIELGLYRDGFTISATGEVLEVAA